jgi:hypothetical protein
MSPFKTFFSSNNRSRNAYLFVLIGVFFLILLINFPYGSWLTGWDNLHPEFNFGWNISNALRAVWQSHQGLGTYGGHGYAATLPHTILLFFMSFVIPLMYLRSSFTFLMLIVGAMGIFFLLRKILSSEEENLKNKAALFGGLFYMLNFGTIQNFYIQLEAFIVHFAALPWLFYTLIHFLEKKSKKNLFIFCFVSLITTTQGFIPPLFFVYMILLSIFLFFYTVFGQPAKMDSTTPHQNDKISEDDYDFAVGGTLERASRQRAMHMSTGGKGQAGQNLPQTISRFKMSVLIIALTLLINAYWFFPVVYYSFSNSGTYLNAYNNLTSTEDFILKNKKYGDIKDVALIKGFIFDTIDADNGTVFPIFKSWQDHLKDPLVALIGYGSFLLICIGGFMFFKRRKNVYNLGFLGGLVVSFSLLATNTFPFTLVSDLFQIIPITKQAFRVAFTKFSISLSFFYAIAFGLGIFGLLYLCNRLLASKVVKDWVMRSISILLFLLIIFFSFPTFQGHFLYQRTKIVIPNSYFQLFDYLKQIPKDERIANFPQGWHWGWTDYKWGYSGSGFLWYGVQQPIMDRAYDVWGNYNEDYYWQLSYALFSEKFDLINAIVDKYQISYILFDNNVIPYPNVKGFLYSDKLGAYLNNSPKYTLVKTFMSSNKSSDDILLYKVSLKNPPVDNVVIYPLNLTPNIGPIYNFTNYDRAFIDYSTYYSDPASEYDIYYPYRSLFTSRKPDELNITINDDAKSLSLISNIPTYLKYVPVNIASASPALHITNDGSQFKTQIGDDLYKPIYDSKNDKYFLNHTANNCVDPAANSDKYKQYIVSSSLRFESADSENCYSIIEDQLNQRNSYLIKTVSNNISGQPLQFALINQDSRKADIEFSLTNKKSPETQYSIVPPMKQYGLGYNLNFNNVSIGDEKTINDLHSVSVSSLPYLLLSSMNLKNPNMPNKTGSLITYDQSFNKDWKAYEVSNIFEKIFPIIGGKELNHHVLVDNWANGWIIDNQSLDTSHIVFVFWPQYFEYVGFGFILVLLGYFGYKYIVKKH